MSGRDDASRELPVTSRRRQRDLLRSWSTWAMTSILLDPAQVNHVRDSGWSGTHHSDPTTGERSVGTTDGLGFGVDDSWQQPREVVAWPDLEAIAREVPAEVRAQLVEFHERLRDHRKTYPRFAASADAVGCGPIIEGQPLTPRQEAYLRELGAFKASGVLQTWERKRAALDVERLEIHELALTGGLGSEPVDLLELLEDDPHTQIQVTLATDPNLPPETLQAQPADENPRVHEANARNTAAPEGSATGQRPGLHPPAPLLRQASELHRRTPATGVAR